jgi:RHS repeat-associated protein
MSFAIKREQNENLLSVMPSVGKTSKANGRLYDPLVGRFLSPDNYVQDASSTQNFNRYGYCLNNPLRYTDPDGEMYWGLFSGAVSSYDGIGRAGEGMIYAIDALTNHNQTWVKIARIADEIAYQVAMYIAFSQIGGAIQVYGTIPSALVGGGTNVGTNGLSNAIQGKPFFDGWEWSLAMGVIGGGIEGYNNARSIGANPWTGKLFQNERVYSSTAKTGISLQPNPERDCYGYALEYADNGHSNRSASYFLGNGDNAPGAYAGDIARKSGIKVNWSRKINGAEWDNVGGSLLQGREILATTSRDGVNHWVNMTSITTADKWKILGGGWRRVLRSTSIWDPIKGHVSNGPINFFSVLSLF